MSTDDMLSTVEWAAAKAASLMGEPPPPCMVPEGDARVEVALASERDADAWRQALAEHLPADAILEVWRLGPKTLAVSEPEPGYE